MSNPDNNEDGSPLLNAEDNESRDPVWLRWAKFLSIIVVAGVFFGALFAFSIHIAALVDASDFKKSFGAHAVMQRDASRDTAHAFRVRFIIGACIGGGLGLVYMIRCLIKRVDP